MAEEIETYTFKTEVAEFLRSFSENTANDTDIFLQELISNASNDLDKVWIARLIDPSHQVPIPNDDLWIDLFLNKEEKTFTITDRGPGMSKADLIHKFNSRKPFMELLTSTGTTNWIVDTGFYSMFLVAEKITVASKQKNDQRQYLWEFSGGNTFTICKDPGERLEYGTRITLHMKRDQVKYLEVNEINRIITKFSSFIRHSIALYIVEKRPEMVRRGTENIIVWPKDVEITNIFISEQPIWTRCIHIVKPKEYTEFYKFLTKDLGSYLGMKHFSAESSLKFKALLFFPKIAPSYLKKCTKNIQLYIRGKFITDECEHLIPDYLSFVKGVVDLGEYQLDIVRTPTQQHWFYQAIRQRLVDKCIEFFENLTKNEKMYKKFAEQLHLWIDMDPYQGNREKWCSLLRFRTSFSGYKTRTLKEIVCRMDKKNQSQIYFVARGKQATNTTLAERVKMRHRELVYKPDYFDDRMLEQLKKYCGKTLKLVTIENSQLPKFKKKEK